MVSNLLVDIRIKLKFKAHVHAHALKVTCLSREDSKLVYNIL